MFRLAMIIHSMVATTLMGVGVVAALTAGLDGARPIVAAAAAGFVLAVPATWLIVRRILAR